MSDFVSKYAHTVGEFIVAALILTMPAWVPIWANVVFGLPYSAWGL